MFVGPVASSSAQVIRAIACATSLVRGLTAHTPVVAHSIDAVTLRNTITRIADSDTAGLPIAGSTATLQLLGVLGPGDDLRAIWHSQYSTDAAAQYDPAAKSLYVRESNGHYTPLDRAIISVSYTHLTLPTIYSV